MLLVCSRKKWFSRSKEPITPAVVTSFQAPVIRKGIPSPIAFMSQEEIIIYMN